uniref:Uncharacterized protein n=1 Tax=Lygus hesperus TaxID=30085 RepID=A0A0A9YTM9_LYGHE
MCSMFDFPTPAVHLSPTSSTPSNIPCDFNSLSHTSSDVLSSSCCSSLVSYNSLSILLFYNAIQAPLLDDDLDLTYSGIGNTCNRVNVGLTCTTNESVRDTDDFDGKRKSVSSGSNKVIRR